MTCQGRMGRAAGLAGAFGGIVFALLLTNGTSRSANAVAVQKDEPKFTLVGAGACQGCHNQPVKPDNPAYNPTYKQTQSFNFVRLEENNVWDEHDLHKQALWNLVTDASVKDYPGTKANPIANRMEANLGREKKGYKTSTDARCLACHTSSKHPITKKSLELPIEETFEFNEGVGCEMCHGHASKYRVEHALDVGVKGKPAPGEPTRDVPWRTKEPGKKFDDFGLVNLRDPAVAAAKCASCHVGNKEEGRFVTHEMYAAGHPPLPPLDLMAYSREQPRHWGAPSQMPYLVAFAKKDAKKAYDLFHYKGAVESEVARRLVESTIGTVKATAALMDQLAKVPGAKDDGLDFAAFDCYSCHHDLKFPSDRQARGYEGPPGRPQFRTAHFDLASVLVGDDTLAKQLDEARRALAFSFGNRTYGNPDGISAAMVKVNDWCKVAEAKVAAAEFKPMAVAAMLGRIHEAAARETRPVGDPELAQLYLWAATTLSLEYADAKDGMLPAEIKAMRDKLAKSVVIHLREDRKFDFEVKAGVKLDKPQQNVSERIEGRMKIFNAFDGKLFRDAFKK